jgi:hypothetical protein
MIMTMIASEVSVVVGARTPEWHAVSRDLPVRRRPAAAGRVPCAGWSIPLRRNDSTNPAAPWFRSTGDPVANVRFR